MKALCPIRAVVLLAFLLTPAVATAQFTFVTNNGAITITRYTGPGGNVIIPSTTNGFPVVSIETNAFHDCYSLTSVMIPDGITNIGDNAFYYCMSLTNVVIGNGVSIIGSNAFYYCTSLTGVIIPEHVTTIGERAFWVCSHLTSITVNTNNLAYSSAGGVLFNKDQTKLIAYPEGLKGGYTIPNSVTSIGTLAFYLCSSLNSVTIPNGVTNIGDRAFFDCSSLVRVTIPSNVTSIGIASFFGCSLMNSITVNTNNPFYSSVAGVLFNKNQTTLLACPCGLNGNYTIPNTVTNIGDEAFEDCAHLTSVTIPNSVIGIGNFAFSQCQWLTSVTIPSSVTSIGSNAFSQCTILSQAYFCGNAPNGDNTMFTGAIGRVYYLPGTTGWGSTFGGWPTALWYQPNPAILGNGYGLSATTNGFGFTISWATNTSVVVEASTNLANPLWTPVTTNGLVAGTNYFTDPSWTNYPNRFYRVRSP